MRQINIARDFSVFPGGRTPEDGLYSGEEFRENLLIPALKTEEKLQIELDGTRGYGSSFLEEAFGGLVRCGYNKEKLLKQITFISSRKGLIQEIESYIEDAQCRHPKKL